MGKQWLTWAPSFLKKVVKKDFPMFFKAINLGVVLVAEFSDAELVFLNISHL